MNVTVNLPPDIEQAYLAQAQAKGLSFDELVESLLLAMQPSPPPAELSPEEWIREFRAWVASHAGDNLPVLSDEAISREFIYRDRGL
jgi:hypothetical protein